MQKQSSLEVEDRVSISSWSSLGFAVQRQSSPSLASQSLTGPTLTWNAHRRAEPAEAEEVSELLNPNLANVGR